MKIQLGQPYSDWTNFPVRFEECNPANPELFDRYAVQAEQFLGFKPKVLQMVLSDRNGKFADDPAYEREFMSNLQPLLSSPIGDVEAIVSRLKGK